MRHHDILVFFGNFTEDKAEGLADVRGTSAHGFLKAQIVREINRTRAAVRDAIALVG